MTSDKTAEQPVAGVGDLVPKGEATHRVQNAATAQHRIVEVFRQTGARRSSATGGSRSLVSSRTWRPMRSRQDSGPSAALGHVE
jgi:hypothetical protein